VYWREVKLLTCIVDHCDYPYCRAVMLFDDWEQRNLHIKLHCDLKAAAGLILQLGEGKLGSFDGIFTRNGTLESLQQTVTSFYGPDYSLQSLRLPWTPQKEDWQPVRTFPEEMQSRIPDSNRYMGRSCPLCKREKYRQCPLCKVYKVGRL
jgi:hypothetical protein